MRFDRRQPRTLRDRWLQLSPGADRRGDSPPCLDVEHDMAAARRFGAPILSRGGGTSLAGQCCNVAVVMDFSKYMHRIIEIDPQRKLARVQPGCVLDTLRNTAANNIGLNLHRPRNPRPLHARRDARQQLLRGSFAHGQEQRHGPAMQRQHRRDGECSPTTAHAFASGRLRRLSLIASSAPAAARVRSMRRMKALVDKYADRIRCRISQTRAPRIRDTTSTNCCRRTALTSPGRWSAPNHARHHSRSDVTSRARAQGALAADLRLSRHLPRRRSRDEGPGVQAHRPGGNGSSADHVRQEQGR